ncbi:MAG: polysaccharide pyruvyl transferase family protein, partial [Bacteroidales bacterium]|nr:polysaccharide pyruvyl transferase family protein [Bacteroidales bacterium]
MKIGILTLRLHFNYGGILQAYALQTYLKKQGHEVWLINKAGYRLNQDSAKETFFHLVKILLGRKYSSLQDDFDSAIICKHTSEFIQKYISPITPPIYNAAALKWLEIYNFDAIIVGSDQVWSKRFGGINSYFLDFVTSNTKKIAYSASFGEDKWLFSNKRTLTIRKLVKKFDAVSVREDSGVVLCKKYLGINATHLIDPTMLLTKDDYFRLCELENTSRSDGDLLLYLLDENRFEWGLKIAKFNKLNPFSVRSKTEDKTASIEDRIYPPITNWLRGFYDAKFVVTDSFHGCIFSIIFNKPFIVIEHGIAGNARMHSLLKMFGLETRMIHREDQLTEKLMSEKIDFNPI